MSAQKGAGTLPLIISVVAILAVAFFFLSKGNFSQTPSQTFQTKPDQKQLQKALPVDEAMALGGTCFTKPFESTADSEKGNIKKIGIGVKGDNAVFVWEFKNPLPPDNHIIRLFVKHIDGGEIMLGREPAYGNKWTATFAAANRKPGEIEKFEADTKESGNLVEFSVPKKYLEKDGKIEGLQFSDLILNKETQEQSSDSIMKDAPEGAQYAKQRYFSCEN